MKRLQSTVGRMLRCVALVLGAGYASLIFAQACPEKNLFYWQAFPPGANPTSLRVTSKWF